MALYVVRIPKGQGFAADFLQIPPRDGHPCLKLMVATAKLLPMPGALDTQGQARDILKQMKLLAAELRGINLPLFHANLLII